MRWLSRANDIDCLKLIWCVYSLQSGNERAAARYIDFPRAAVTKSPEEPNSIYKWELETITTLLLTTPKDREREGKYHFTNLTHFGSMGSAIAYLRKVEGAEYAFTSVPERIFEELYRIGQRQFSWQRGYNRENLYRFAYVYGQGECGDFFQETHGLTVADFMMMSFILFGMMHTYAWMNIPDVATLGFNPAHMAKTVELHSLDLADVRRRAVELKRGAVDRLGQPLRTAYQPSVLRERPMISTNTRGGGIIAPLPPLVMGRATSGLFYDIRKGPRRLIIEANARFEEYVRLLIRSYCPRFVAMGTGSYGTKRHGFETPDILVRNGQELAVVFECKATKLTFEAQFAENPVVAAADGFQQMAKGVFQLWRLFSHARRGIYTEYAISADTRGVVLTMDGWMQLEAGLRDATMRRARELCGASDPDITEEDMRIIVFMSVQELNDVFCETNEDTFLQTLTAAAQPANLGDGIIEMARNLKLTGEKRPFPLDMGDVLPWYPDFDERCDEYVRRMSRAQERIGGRYP